MKGFTSKRKRIAIALLTAACSMFAVFGAACSDDGDGSASSVAGSSSVTSSTTTGGGSSSTTGGGSSSSSSATATTVVGFEDQQVNVPYNTDVSLNAYVTAEDDIGEAHKGVPTVKDSTGATVELFENRFTATDKNGYTVTVSVEVAGKTFTKTVTITVIDASIPTIKMDYLLQGLVGQTYTLPTITVTKAYDTTPIEPEVKLYFDYDGAKEEITLENDAFVPAKEGYYTIKVVATDRFGYSKEQTQTFFIQDPANIAPMPDGVLENYSEESSATRVSLGSATDRVEGGSKVTWLESYTTNEETRNGVLKVSLKAGDYFWLNLTRTPAQLKELGITEITVKAAIANSTGTADNMLRWNASSGDRHNQFGVGSKTGEAIPWQEITISVETLEAYARFATAGVWDTLGNGGTGNWFIRAAADAVVYIDEITYYVPPQEEPMPAGTLENFSHENVATRLKVANDAGVATSGTQPTWLESYTTNNETRTGVAKVVLKTGNYFWLNLTRTPEELKALGVESITVKAAIASSTGTADDMLRWNASGEKNNQFGVGTVTGNEVAWQEITVSVETLETYARFATAGVWDTLGKGGAGNWFIRAAADAIVYIDEITYFAPPAEEPMPTGVLENFSSEYYTEKRYSVAGGSVEWLESYTVGEETKNGVLHATLGTNQYLTAQFSRTAAELEALGVTTITFKMAWTSTSTTAGNSLRFSDDKSTGDTGTYAGSNKLNSGAWETVTITLAELNAFKRFDSNAWSSLGSDGVKNWLIRCAYASTTVELYIDEITYS